MTEIEFVYLTKDD